jgi:phage tail-like protein
MPRSGGFDPLDKFRWRVYVASPSGVSWSRGGFASCSSPGITIQYDTYQEGGSHMNPRKIHQGATYKGVTLTRGIVAKAGIDDFIKWIKDAFNAMSHETGTDLPPNYRSDIVIEHLDRDASVVKRWILRNCIPTAYEAASDFDAKDDNSVSIEALTFEYEGFEEERPDSLLSDLADVFRRTTRGIF